MNTWWPWLLLAGMGALHGAHPANGWMWASVRGFDPGAPRDAWRVLWPVALGHVVAIAATVYAISQGVLMGGPWPQRIAGGLLLLMAAGYLRRGHRGAPQPGLALSTALTSAMMATSQGAGLMLVPALLPLCMSGLPAREITAGGSLLLGLAAVVVHLLAMLVTAAVIASVVRAGVRCIGKRSWLTALPWNPMALALVGIALVVTA
ncbi:MAG TPA: hypothetical protein VIP30_02985 [Stenotrophomonas sp.]